jgi:hypothetical protein
MFRGSTKTAAPESPVAGAAWFCLLGCLLSLTVPAACQKSASSRPQAKKGSSGMPSFQLAITPQQAEVLAGESLKVTAKLTNPGPNAVDAPSPDAPSEFEFVLWSTADNQPRYTLSALRARRSKVRDSAPPLERETVSLKPGAALTYNDDLMDYALSPPLPGRYLLSVFHGKGAERVESPRVPLTLTAPRVAALSAIAGANGRRLALVLAQADAAGKQVVLQREGDTDRPTVGVLYRRVEVSRPTAIDGVAAAVELEDGGDGVRWFAWAQGDAVGGGVAQRNTLLERVGPAALGVKSARLYRAGWQPSQEEASFAALGQDARGQINFALIALTAMGDSKVKTVALAAQTMPAHWGVQAQNGVGRFEIVWVETAGGKTRIERQTVTPDIGQASSPTVLSERAEPLAVLALNPLAGTAASVVDVLLGAAGTTGQMTFLRLPLGGGAPLGEWKVNVPAGPQRPSAWALAPMPLANPVVLAKLGDKLLVCRAASGGWQTLAENAAQAEHLRLEVISGHVWAIWADPGTGIHYKQVPLP